MFGLMFHVSCYFEQMYTTTIKEPPFGLLALINTPDMPKYMKRFYDTGPGKAQKYEFIVNYWRVSFVLPSGR